MRDYFRSSLDFAHSCQQLALNYFPPTLNSPGGCLNQTGDFDGCDPCGRSNLVQTCDVFLSVEKDKDTGLRTRRAMRFHKGLDLAPYKLKFLRRVSFGRQVSIPERVGRFKEKVGREQTYDVFCAGEIRVVVGRWAN